MLKKLLVLYILLLINNCVKGQTDYCFCVFASDTMITGALNVSHNGLKIKSNPNNQYCITPSPQSKIMVWAKGYDTLIKTLPNNFINKIDTFYLFPRAHLFEPMVISGTLKEVSKSKSPVNIEVFSPLYFKSNISSNIFDAMQNINGVRPQNNCNVCNTGDIHINGLEGPYTAILIDGMPIVSGLSSVYGLFGIPQSLIERVEIVKGAASTLYGSEAVGGLINVITKSKYQKPITFIETFTNTWGEWNTDVGIQRKIGKSSTLIAGINYFNFQQVIDKNNDGFTDLTLQNRIAFFNKFNINISENKQFSIAGRYIYEDRWGGQTNWNKSFRGGDSVYGESIFTKRVEIFGLLPLPIKQDIALQFSYNNHQQNSFYGTLPFLANQSVGFAQLLWNYKLNTNNDFLAGVSYRFTKYDDNTAATIDLDSTNAVSVQHLPGVFLQHTHNFNARSVVLSGIRYDYNFIHGSIITPRLNLKISSRDLVHTYRLGLGNGYRVANVFTEDHAALTGARTVVFKEKLAPETSWNFNGNYNYKFFGKKNMYFNLDFGGWFTYFTNKIIPDYLSDPNKIIYQNINGFAVSKGVSSNLEFNLSTHFNGFLGITYMEVNQTRDGVLQRQPLTENFSGTWNCSYQINKPNLKISYTGNFYSPMVLPLLGPLDNRSGNSPWYSIQNLQFSKTFRQKELFFGVKNLLNFIPNANSIARPFDPFDKQVTFDANGNALPTPNNPNALTFDPTYVFTSNQGIRFFVGFNIYF